MKLKEGLLLREVAGQYVVVPTGKMASEIPGVHYMSKDAALLWNSVYGREFELSDLVDVLKAHFPNAGEERLQKEAENFVEGARQRLFLENPNGGFGRVWFRYKEEEEK